LSGGLGGAFATTRISFFARIFGTRYEIVIDGTARTHRDREDLAYDAATLLKIKQPHAETRDESDPRRSTK
jgi:hypothetical protein